MSKGGGGQQYYGLPTVTQSNSSTQNIIPEWLTAASQRGISAATDLMNRGTPSYAGQIAPGMTADQQAAGQMFRDNVGAFQGYYDRAAQLTDAATQQGPQINAPTLRQGLSGISDYMNPYISSVVDSVSDLSRRNLDAALTRTADQAIGAKAFGGSRQGVMEGVATAENNRNTNNLVSQLLSQGYDRATGMLGQDISNNLQAQGANQNAFSNYMNRLMGAGGQMASVGGANRQASVGDTNNLLQFGTLGQQTQGAQDQAAYQEFLRQQNYPLLALQAYNQTVQGAPKSTTANTQTSGVEYSPQQQQQSNPLMGALGLGMAGLSMLPGGTIPGLLGGALSTLGGPSAFPRGNYF